MDLQCGEEDRQYVEIENSSASEENEPCIQSQTKCVIALCLLAFVDALGYGLPSAFYPTVAMMKGMDAKQVGVTYSAYSLAGLVSSVFTGYQINRLGPKFFIISGMICCSVSTFCFGMLYMATDASFFWLSLNCRIIMGIGNMAAYTSMYTTIFVVIPDKAITMIGVSEALCGIGGIVGPVFGGLLYQIGGYIAPFLAIGCLQLLTVGYCFFAIPSIKSEAGNKCLFPLKLMMGYNALFASILLVLVYAINSFSNVNFAIYLSDQFSLNSVDIGLGFLVGALSYAVASPMCGIIIDKLNHGSDSLILFGSFFFGVSLILSGPARIILNWFQWAEPRLWLVFVSRAMTGIGATALSIPTFYEMSISARKLSVANDLLSDYGAVAGLWNFSYSMGSIIGPLLGGLGNENINFQDVMAIGGLLIFFMAIQRLSLPRLYLIRTVEHVSYFRLEPRRSTLSRCRESFKLAKHWPFIPRVILKSLAIHFFIMQNVSVVWRKKPQTILYFNVHYIVRPAQHRGSVGFGLRHTLQWLSTTCPDI